MRKFVNGLPETAYQAARASLIAQGFTDDSFFDNYRFSYRDRHIEKVDSVVFAPHSPHHPEYACFTIFNRNDETPATVISDVLPHTTAPFHLIHQHDHYSFVVSKANGKITAETLHDNISYDNLGRFLQDYRADLQPQKIVDVKQGRAQFDTAAFREINSVQLSFWVADVTGKLLAKYFGVAIQKLRQAKVPAANKVALQLLGAVILADTGVLSSTNPTVSLSQLIDTARQRFSNYFQAGLFDAHTTTIEEAYTLLRQINYAGFVPSMLTEIYKQAYDNKTRKELGRFDTPLYLTRRIWDNIPVEFLRPEQRIAVDMTCGWGSFLIAGYERLSRLSDMRNFNLNQHLYGNDLDPFTAQLAQLALLLSTHEDSWQVQAGDALAWDWLQQHQPTIIVGNPPFGGSRKTNQTEQALRYLAHAIKRLATDGYLAMLMPKSFTIGSRSYPTIRKKLLDTCNVYELWELSENTFSAGTRAIAIFAQKKHSSQYPVRIRSVQNITQEQFKANGWFTLSSLVVSQSHWNKKSHRSNNRYLMDYFLILSPHYWHKFSQITLQEKAIVFSGIIKGSPSRWHWTDYHAPKEILWLQNAKAMPFQHVIDYTQAVTAIYPNEFEKPRKNKQNPVKDREVLLKGKKILLVSISDPSFGKRVKLAIERKSCFASHAFWIIVPDQDEKNLLITHEAITAILGWYLSNAWIIEHIKYPWLLGDAIKEIPFPKNLTETDCQQLTQAVLKLEEAAQADEPEPKDALDTIDAILKQAYQLDNATFERLCRVYYWDKPEHPHFKRLCQQYGWAAAQPISFDDQPDPNAWWEISGITEEIYPEQGKIKLWLDGWTKFETVPIVDFMPGWLLRPNVAFRVAIPRECVRTRTLQNVSWGKFYPQEYTYIREEELFEELTDFFYPPESELTP